MILVSRYYLVLGLQILVTFSNCSFSRSKNPLWTWECINEKCVPSRPDPTNKLQSLETCNMLCAGGQIWPQPRGAISLSTTAVPVHADSFRLKILLTPSRTVQEYLQESFELFREDVKRLEQSAFGFEERRSVLVRIAINGSEDPRMRIDTEENYKLVIRPNSDDGLMLVDISASTFCGARHGLETLIQLIWFDPYVASLFMLEAASVDDSPRFKYRGLLLDTARNYFPVRDLMRTIDGMAISKLNTFHWHVTDTQAFPLQLDSVKHLSKRGAYSLRDVYTKDDVRALVHRARLRGIRVLIEIDVPSHVGPTWSFSSDSETDDLSLCTNAQPWSPLCHEPPCGQLNPRNTDLFLLLEQVFTEIIQLTGVDDLFHMGGDDVSLECWEHYFNDTNSENYLIEFTRSSLDRLRYVNGRLPNLTLFWFSSISDRIKTDLKESADFIGLQLREFTWKHKSINGIRTVISHEDAWDLNNGMGAWYDTNGGIPYNSWQHVYEHRPWAKDVANIEGGEATVWSSTLSDDDLDATVWPRAAALAERLWTDRAEGATRPVHARLDLHRSRLVARGLKAAPIWSMWCTQNPYTC
ncbi:probable beta-hexosaminidase fdl isoform X1 [Bombyx mori]|uniref:Beta-hexosaminidase n=1 Tax=Bombyx mori TaxID=7091 RepID=A0A8R2AF11_BOMMO|nr:probable beta-hexosaminidase fdl isoform X1 [Bombyx mori]